MVFVFAYVNRLTTAGVHSDFCLFGADLQFMLVQCFHWNDLIAQIAICKHWALSPEMDIEVVFVLKFWIFFPTKITAHFMMFSLLLFLLLRMLRLEWEIITFFWFLPWAWIFVVIIVSGSSNVGLYLPSALSNSSCNYSACFYLKLIKNGLTFSSPNFLYNSTNIFFDYSLTFSFGFSKYFTANYIVAFSGTPCLPTPCC